MNPSELICRKRTKAKPPKRTVAKQPTGRLGGQPVYTQEIADQICDLLAQGKTLTSRSLPGSTTVRRWALDLNHPFAAQYARARSVTMRWPTNTSISGIRSRKTPAPSPRRV